MSSLNKCLMVRVYVTGRKETAKQRLGKEMGGGIGVGYSPLASQELWGARGLRQKLRRLSRSLCARGRAEQHIGRPRGQTGKE